MFTLLLTCEHASNAIPHAYESHFRSGTAQRALATHAGIDLGALRLAQALQRSFEAPLYCGTVSRLLVELNRSAHHPKLWSQFSRQLTTAEKDAIVDAYYTPHRNAVSSHVTAIARKNQTVLHVGVHSFTPSLGVEVRNADIGLLYDPRRALERNVCTRWQQHIQAAQPGLRVRRNYPYRGNTDGFTTSLRRQFRAERYLGIELEVNQARLVGEASDPLRIARTISKTLRQILTG